MTAIRSLASVQEDLELLWLAGLFHTSDNGWQVRAMMYGFDSRSVRQWALPIGLLPILIPGQAFSGGELVRTLTRGRIDEVVIPSLAAGEEVQADCIPRSLYSFDGHRGWGQRLLRYRIGGKTYLIPTTELVRYLFLHNKTLANAIMQPAGLLALAAPEQPGHHRDLHLHFTRQMPRRSLSSSFVQEFAWLAIHPDGRRSWDSVRAQTRGNRHIGFLPPPLQNCRMSFRGVEWQSTWLVLEIRQLSGRNVPCDRLFYSHPVERHIRYVVDKDGSKFLPARRTQISARAKPQHRSHEIDPEKGSRIDVHQKALAMPGKFSAFDNKVRVEKVKYEETRHCAPDAVPHLSTGTVPIGDGPRSPRPKSVPSSGQNLT